MENLEEQIEDLREQIEELQEQIDNFELDPSDYEEQYNDMLDDCYDGVFNLLPSRILSECDPIAYSCGLNDYIDSLDISDNYEYQQLENEIEELQNELEELENELEELNDELNN